MQANANNPCKALCPSASGVTCADAGGRVRASPHPGAALFGVALIPVCPVRTPRLANSAVSATAAESQKNYVSCTLQGITLNRNISVRRGGTVGDVFILFTAPLDCYNHRNAVSTVLKTGSDGSRREQVSLENPSKLSCNRSCRGCGFAFSRLLAPQDELAHSCPGTLISGVPRLRH